MHTVRASAEPFVWWGKGFHRTVETNASQRRLTDAAQAAASSRRYPSNVSTSAAATTSLFVSYCVTGDSATTSTRRATSSLTLAAMGTEFVATFGPIAFRILECSCRGYEHRRLIAFSGREPHPSRRQRRGSRPRRDVDSRVETEASVACHGGAHLDGGREQIHGRSESRQCDPSETASALVVVLSITTTLFKRVARPQLQLLQQCVRRGLVGFVKGPFRVSAFLSRPTTSPQSQRRDRLRRGRRRHRGRRVVLPRPPRTQLVVPRAVRPPRRRRLPSHRGLR